MARTRMSKKCELIELSAKLLTLKDKGLIAEVEYREIVCNGPLSPLVEGALLKFLFNKYPDHGLNILNFFEVLTAEIPVTANNEDTRRLQNYDRGKNQKTIINPLQQKNQNPLLNNMIIRSVFEFLTFGEIKKCRLVCYQWDSTAQPFLRRKGIIHFHPQSLQSSMFLEVFEDNLPEIPFTAFKFSNVGSNLIWPISQQQMFFEKWGRNIKHLELLNICLGRYNVTPWLEKAKNLATLIFKCNSAPDSLRVNLLELNKLESVKYLHLHGNKIFVCFSDKNMITPLEIILDEVRFIETERVGFDNDVALVRLNNYIDFSKAKNIILTPYANKNTYCAIFDMDTQAFKADKVFLKNVDIQNWNKAKGQIDYLTVFKMRLIEKNELEIKKFVLDSCTIDMAIIPLTIHQIHFANKRTVIICDHSIVLPKLEYLGFSNVTQNTFNMLSRFAYCNNLVEIQIEKHINNFYSLTLKVSMIPKSVKRMKVLGNVKLVGDDNGVVCTLDKLILRETCCEMKDFFNRVSVIFSTVFNFNVKVLVIDSDFYKLDSVISHYELVIINFVQANQHLEKIIIGNLQYLFKNKPFKGSSFSRCVDRESHYYEFQKNKAIGKAITKDRFLLWKSLHIITFTLD